MRYFFIVYAIIAVAVVGIFGFRGQHFSKPPIRLFPDMDEQDKLKAQKPSSFFADGLGSRLPVQDTLPRGFNEDGKNRIGTIVEPEFSGEKTYYHSGYLNDYYGTGLPNTLDFQKAEEVKSFIEKGKERYGIYCAVCHGAAGDGAGITSKYGVPAIANFHLEMFQEASYPDGKVFETITKGKGQMGGYGATIPVRDRWAIIAYMRTLQAAKLSTAK